MKKNINKKNRKFEEDYFEGHYKNKVGEFNATRDREMSNWFKGSFGFVNRFVPIKNSKGKRVLEFGCAYGSSSSVLHEFGLEVVATDISELAVKRAKKLHPKINFKTHDMQKLFKTNEKFDYVLAMDVIEHLERPEEAVRNIFKVLKPGGTAIISTQNDLPYKMQDPTHISVKKPEDWKKIFKKSGFSEVIVTPATYFPPYLYRINWRLNFIFPVAIFSTLFLSTVFIFAKKRSRA